MRRTLRRLVTFGRQVIVLAKINFSPSTPWPSVGVVVHGHNGDIEIATGVRATATDALEAGAVNLVSTAPEIVQHNERAKYLAAALDRAATAFFQFGVIAPLAGVLLNLGTPREGAEYYLVALTAGYTLVGIGLHLQGRRALGALR